ncbi:protein SON-like [Bolinopsis microptera]|uniref:protein SON-like n=1 Tax=Bolinopsis microptera TaxID=2820187 RepID=UPI00307AF27E
MSNNNNNNNNNNPFLSVSCDKCKIPITSDTRFEYLCGHIICRICDTGRSCQYCGHPGVANQHNNNDGPSTSNDICEACEDTALYYCVTCPKLLCERCAHIHSVNAARKDHQVVYLKDYPRQIQDSSVNYDIPENVYLPRKRTPETAGEDIPSSRRRRPQLDRRDTWDRSAETRKPFRKNSAPIKQFSYSKSISSRASSVQSFQESMDKLSDRSYDKFSMKSEKSVGTDVSGVASMIKNNHFTIMVYTNSEPGSVCSGPPGQIRVVRNADPTAEVEAILSKPDCRDCGKTGSKPVPEDGEYHDHRVYIQRKASTVSSSSSTSFSSHCCESHLGEYSRSKSANPHSLVSKSDTMDDISDILNVSNDLRRSASPRAASQDTRGTSPGLFLVTSEEGNSEPPEEQMVDLYEQLFSPNYTTPPPKYEHHHDIPLLSDIDKGTEGFISNPPVNQSTPENATKVDILDTNFPSTKSASSKSSISSVDSKHSPGEQLTRSSFPGSKEPVKLVDDLLDKYTAPTVEPSEIEKLQHSNVTITSDTSEPCMVPQKSTDNMPELINRSSPLLERVRKQSLGKDNIEFIDEKLFDTSSEDEEEEPFVGNETYLTHSSHYSGSLEEDNLSNIAEEPSLETCSATEMIERKVSESMTNLQDHIEQNPEHSVEVDGPPVVNRYDVLVIPSDKYPAEPEQGLLVFDDDDPEIMFDVESIGDEGDIDIMVTEQSFITVNTVPNFIALSEGNEDDDKMSVKSMSSESSKASSKKQFSYSKPILTHQNKPLLYSEVLKSKPSNILPDDISNRNPLARSSSGEKLRKSLSKDDLCKFSPEDIAHDTPESMKDVQNKPIKKSPSNGSLSRIPVRRTSRGSSDSKERSRSSSRDSSLEGPRRRSSLDSNGKNSRRTSRSSSGESLSKIPIRRSSLGKKRRNSNEIIRSPSRDSLKSDQSGKPYHSKPPLPRSHSKDGIEKKTDNRRKSSSDSKDCHEKNNIPDISPKKSGQKSEAFSTKSTPPKSPSREVYEGIGIKTFSRSTSKDSLSGKSDISMKRRSSSPSKIPTRMSRSESIESIGRSSVSSKGSFAYKRSRSPKQPNSPSRIPVVKSPSTDRKVRYNSISSNNSEPYSTGQVFSLVSASKDSMISRHSTISNLSQPQPLNEDQLHSASLASSDFPSSSKCPPGEISAQPPSSDDYLPHHRKDSSSSSSSDDNPPIVYFDVVGVDHAKPTDEITDQAKLERQSNRSRNSDRSIKSSQSGNSKQSVSSNHSKPTTKTSLIDENDTVSECSGSFISDNSFLRKHHSAQITYSDSEDSNNPVSTKKIMLDRILSGNYGNKGENLGFMDSMSDREGSFAGVSSDGLEKLGKRRCC